MADGGGGGGMFDSVTNYYDQVFGDFAEPFTGTKKKEAMKKEAFNAERDQAKREKAMAEQEQKTETQGKFASSKNRQKMLSGRGRSSTILTSPLGTPTDGAASSASGKTLLGS
jgi:hypothetical protein